MENFAGLPLFSISYTLFRRAYFGEGIAWDESGSSLYFLYCFMNTYEVRSFELVCLAICSSAAHFCVPNFNAA